MAIALILFGLLAAADIGMSPDPPVAGKEVRITCDAVRDDGFISIASPMGLWREQAEADAGGTVTLTLPAGTPLVLTAAVGPEDLDIPHAAAPVVNGAGKPMARSHFWLAYLNAGFPAPWPMETTSAATALANAKKEVEAHPSDSIARELLWRLQVQSAGSEEAVESVLQIIRGELAGSTDGRLAQAAAAIHVAAGNVDEARQIEETWSAAIHTVRKVQDQRLQAVVQTQDPAARVRMILSWLEEDPFNPHAPALVQMVAPSFMAGGDMRSTAIYGLMSLRMTPDDAMTLNGVAYAMAEGGFQRPRALILADRALDILSRRGGLRKPEGMSELRWRVIIDEARSATLDTRGWLLTGLGQYEDAEMAFENALDLKRSDEIYLHFAKMLLMKGDRVRAEEMLKTGLRMSGPHRAEIQDLLADLHD